MSASQSSPLAANLQESIEHLIAETVRRSQTSHEEERQQLREALQAALTEVEAGQAAMERAALTLRSALEASPASAAPAIIPDGLITDEETESPDSVEPGEPAALPDVVESETGPHEIDIIAHDVTIGIATGLQSMLRSRAEVKSAQTREFVNGELRLRLEMDTKLDVDALTEWIAQHKGRITAQTDSVIELRFGD